MQVESDAPDFRSGVNDTRLGEYFLKRGRYENPLTINGTTITDTDFYVETHPQALSGYSLTYSIEDNRNDTSSSILESLRSNCRQYTFWLASSRKVAILVCCLTALVTAVQNLVYRLLLLRKRRIVTTELYLRSLLGTSSI